EAEWRKLTERFPDLLGPERLGAVKLALDEAEVAGRGKVVRLRIDGFTDKLEARDLCQAFAAQRQPCLVVRTAAGG
ncbi:MAG TPA: SPOR domain-containing protein, partial [Kiloniellales bacterium]|nr:SPOR domain-containing protein [Kiloniellales bacterium]